MSEGKLVHRAGRLRSVGKYGGAEARRKVVARLRQRKSENADRVFGIKQAAMLNAHADYKATGSVKHAKKLKAAKAQLKKARANRAQASKKAWKTRKAKYGKKGRK